MIERILGLLFGGNRQGLKETFEVFRVNAEAESARNVEVRKQALEQLAAEFERPTAGRFDRFMDAINRVPRPALALGTIGLFVAAMVDPVWFAARMTGISLVPEPLWWLLGVIVSFYFGARHQTKGQEFQREMAATLARVPRVVDSLALLDEISARREPAPDHAQVRVNDGVSGKDDNPALAEWRKNR